MMLIPEKLTPIPGLDKSVLPSWIADFGTIDPCDELPKGGIVMTANGPHGEFFHVDAQWKDDVAFDESFWARYAEPMVNNLGGALFEAEWPGMMMQTFRWQAEADIGRKELSSPQRKIIARRNELSWKAPALTD